MFSLGLDRVLLRFCKGSVKVHIWYKKFFFITVPI